MMRISYKLRKEQKLKKIEKSKNNIMIFKSNPNKLTDLVTSFIQSSTTSLKDR